MNWTRLFVTLAALPVASIWAQPGSRTGAAFASIGVATGQTVRLNAVNLGSRTSTLTSSCSVTLRFLDAQGSMVKESTIAIVNTKSAFLDLTHDQAGEASRVQIRAVVLFGPSAGGAPPGPDARDQLDCNISPSVEIFDSSSGKTSILLTDWKPLPSVDPRSIG